MSYRSSYNIIKHSVKWPWFKFNRNRVQQYSYNRKLAAEYAENYALGANTSKYPIYKENDCTNFVCQALVAGGMKMVGNDYKKFSQWFCYSKDPSKLQSASLTWRSAQYFRMYWGNRNGVGSNVCKEFKKLTVEEAILNFDEIYNSLMIGDIIQYGDFTDTPYHTQIIHGKELNIVTGKMDIFVAQHTANRKHVSFNEYLRLLDKRKTKYVYIYHL